MADCINGKEWDPEGIADFSDFPTDKSDVKFQDPVRWPLTWMDEDEREDFMEQLQRDKKQGTADKPEPGQPKLESCTTQFKWTADNESIELKKTIDLVKSAVGDKPEALGSSEDKK